MYTDALGKRFIRSSLAVGEFDLNKYGLEIEHFDFDARIAAKWIVNFKNEYKKLPTESQLSEIVDIEFLKEPESVEYLVDRLKERQIADTLETDLRDIAKVLRDTGGEAALKLFKECASTKKLEGKEVTRFIGDAPARYERYLQRHAEQDFGIPSPWPSLNDAILGFIGGEFTVLMAPPSIGKSWCCCYLASHFLKLNLRVLFISMEMRKEAISDRLDALHYQIPFIDVRKADMDIFTEKRWKESMCEAKGEVFLADENTVRNVSDITALCESHEVDVVIVDGAYRLRSRDKGSNWEQSANVAREIQTDCKHTNVPWITTTQMNISEKKMLTGQDRGVNVRYTREWYILPEMLIELDRSEEQRDFLHQMTFHMVKVRESTGTVKQEFITNWDLDGWNFDEIMDDEEIDLEVDY